MFRRSRWSHDLSQFPVPIAKSVSSFQRTWTNGGIKTSLPSGISGSCSDLDPFVPQEWISRAPHDRVGKGTSCWMYRETAQQLQLFPGPGGMGPVYEMPEQSLTRTQTIPIEQGVILLLGQQYKKVVVHCSVFDSSIENVDEWILQTMRGFSPVYCRYNAVTGALLPFHLQAKRPESRAADQELPGVFNVVVKPGNYLVPRAFKSLWVSKADMQEHGWWNGLKQAESQIPDTLKLTPQTHLGQHNEQICPNEEEFGGGGGYFHISCFKRSFDILADVSTKTHFNPLMTRLGFGASGLSNLDSLPFNPGWNSDDYQIGMTSASPSQNFESLLLPDQVKALRRVADAEGFKSRRWLTESSLDQTKHELLGCGLAHPTGDVIEGGTVRNLTWYNRDQFSGSVGDDDLLSLAQRVALLKKDDKKLPSPTTTTTASNNKDAPAALAPTIRVVTPMTAEEEEAALEQRVGELEAQIRRNNKRLVALDRQLRELTSASSIVASA